MQIIVCDVEMKRECGRDTILWDIMERELEREMWVILGRVLEGVMWVILERVLEGVMWVIMGRVLERLMWVIMGKVVITSKIEFFKIEVLSNHLVRS